MKSIGQFNMTKLINQKAQNCYVWNGYNDVDYKRYIIPERLIIYLINKHKVLDKVIKLKK